MDSEDWYAAVLQLESGACATLEGSRCASGWKGRQVVEAYGSDLLSTNDGDTLDTSEGGPGTDTCYSDDDGTEPSCELGICP